MASARDAPRDRPLLLYDRDCRFCVRWIRRWRAKTGDRVSYVALQDAPEDPSRRPADQIVRLIHLVEPDGTVHSGAAAVFRALREAPRGGWLWWAYRRVPGFGVISERVYRLAAAHRTGLGRITTLLWGEDPEPSAYRITSRLFLSGLGIVTLLAFLSLWAQVHGLIGSDGILPVQPYLERVHEARGADGYRLLPTLLWLSPTDTMLHLLCACGVVASLLIIAGIFTAPALLIAWSAYLSLVGGGQAFLSFQWDMLLLETLFAALFWASWRPTASPAMSPPSRAGLVVLRFVLFKLMFLSGVTKLLSGDPTWHALTALDFHYESQPLPTWPGWYAHQLPAFLQRASVGFMFLIEIAAPFFFVAPRRMRHLAGASLLLLQMLIAMTGNYGFFNLLTALLCVPLFDDRLLRSVLPGVMWNRIVEATSRRVRGRARATVTGLLAVAVMIPSALSFFEEMVRTMRRQQAAARGDTDRTAGLPGATGLLEKTDRLLLSWANPLILERVRPFRTFNGYGLFRNMTTERIEISIEGSDDGSTWRRYPFRWKPGDVNVAPRFVAPHHPRLDWQMWFASLDPRGNSYWLESLCRRLLDRSPRVLALFASDPFPDRPPRQLRLVLERYRFTDRTERRETGAWWRTEHVATSRPIRP